MDEDGARGGEEQLVMMSPNQIMLSISLQQEPGDGCRRPTAWLSYPFPLARHQRCVQQQNGSMTKTTFLFSNDDQSRRSFIYFTFMATASHFFDTPLTHQRAKETPILFYNNCSYTSSTNNCVHLNSLGGICHIYWHWGSLEIIIIY